MSEGNSFDSLLAIGMSFNHCHVHRQCLGNVGKQGRGEGDFGYGSVGYFVEEEGKALCDGFAGLDAPAFVRESLLRKMD